AAGNNTGTYTITATTANPNFDITVNEGTYTINQKALTVNVENKTKTYGDADPEWTVNLNGALDALGLFEVDYSREDGEDVGTYDITAEVTNPNYIITVVDGTLTVTPRLINVVMIEQEQTYGDSDTLITYTLSEEDYRLELNLTTFREPGVDVGFYDIDATHTNPNFTIE